MEANCEWIYLLSLWRNIIKIKDYFPPHRHDSKRLNEKTVTEGRRAAQKGKKESPKDY